MTRMGRPTGLRRPTDPDEPNQLGEAAARHAAWAPQLAWECRWTMEAAVAGDSTDEVMGTGQSTEPDSAVFAG